MASIDHFYQQGLDHILAGLPCQDYARSWSSPCGEYFVGAVADGCSGSKGDPLVGAVLLANQAISLAQGALNAGLNFKEVGFHASLLSWAKQGMDDVVNLEDWLATLVFFVKSPDCLKVYMFGDGCICVRYKEGETLTQYVEYPFNAPFYLAYNASQEVLDSFSLKDNFGATQYSILMDKEGKDIQGSAHRVDTRELVFDFTKEMQAGEIHSISVFTDGLQQMKAQETAALRWVGEAAGIFTDFKTTQGNFVRRLCTKRFSSNKRKDFPQDDFAQATLIL